VVRCLQVYDRVKLQVSPLRVCLRKRFGRDDNVRVETKANIGWERMTATQRRQQLLGVFYYQTPDARERRAMKLADEAERHGGA